MLPYANSVAQITNCTFYDNHANLEGGAIWDEDNYSTITNSILWDNSAPTGPEIYGSPTVNYSDVEGGYTGTGNINENPQFVSISNILGPDEKFGTLDDGLRLHRINTPLYPYDTCIDTADDTAAPETDCGGFERVDIRAETFGVGDRRNGIYVKADMGAYETQWKVDGSGDYGGFTTINEAINTYTFLGAGITYFVMDGTYFGSGNTDLGFPPGIELTLISENGPDSCIINCENNSRGFVFDSGEGSDTVVDGFTIVDGWGSNTDGRINVPAGYDFVDLAAGMYHSLALRSNGSLVAWGSNGWG